MYHHLAHLYDWSGALEFSEHLRHKLLALLDAQAIRRPGPLLDLACGTGTMSIALAQDGWHVTGLDRSPAMLGQAKRKTGLLSPFPSHDLRWIEDNMCTFTLPDPVAAVFCLYDSLNHLLTEDDLIRCFQSVTQALHPGGLFVFDLNTEENYDTFWQGIDTDEGPNVRLTFNATYFKETGRATIAILAEEHTEDGLVMMEDHIEEQHYAAETVERMLRQCGFQNIHTEPLHLPFLSEEPPLENAPLKTFWWCVT